MKSASFPPTAEKQSLGQDPTPLTELTTRNATSNQSTSNHNARTRTLPSPSPRDNRQHNNSQHIHLARNPQQPAFLRLRHHGPFLRLVEVDTPVGTPEELVRGCGEDVVERALEDVAQAALDVEVVRVGFLVGWFEEGRVAGPGGAEALAA